MFLFIPAAVLQSTKLSGDEKVTLSYLWCLHQKGGICFASKDYLNSLLGLQDSMRVLEDLSKKQIVQKQSNGWTLTPKSVQFILSKL